MNEVPAKVNQSQGLIIYTIFYATFIRSKFVYLKIIRFRKWSYSLWQVRWDNAEEEILAG